MPEYLFELNGQIKSVFQKMTEPHVFFENGIQWKRVWVNPQASFDTKIDPFSSREFVSKSGTKRGTVGDLLNTSKELSERRKSKLGKDPLAEKYLDNWSKKRKGRLHPEVARQKAKDFASSQGIDIEF